MEESGGKETERDGKSKKGKKKRKNCRRKKKGANSINWLFT